MEAAILNIYFTSCELKYTQLKSPLCDAEESTQMQTRFNNCIHIVTCYSCKLWFVVVDPLFIVAHIIGEGFVFDP